MDLSSCIARLRANGAALVALARQMDGEAARWSPAPDAWCVLEVVNHLADEEAEDFRTRLRLTLTEPEADWPPIDPQGWVKARDYASRRLGPSIERFRAERAASLGWLVALGPVDWTAEHVHPAFGAMSAGNLMAAWVDHDLHHLRQLVDLQHRWWTRAAAPYDAGYAGDW